MTIPKKRPKTANKTPAKEPAGEAPRCGLCGKKRKLVRTECCGQWICDDEASYALFSYARNSCHRNHSRMTLCGYHDCEGHKGKWQDCPECKSSFPTEMYVWYGTNEYNFEKLANPPVFEPTHCGSCGAVIHMGMGGYSEGPKGILCGICTRKAFPIS